MMNNETPVERRLRDLVTVSDGDYEQAIDCGREAIRLLRKYGEFGYCLEMWLADRDALLARCTEGPR